MRTKRSFFLSIFLHAGIITGVVALSALSQEKEEEVVLELVLSEPVSSNEEQLVVKQTVSVPQRIQPTQPNIATMVSSDPIVKAQKPDPKVEKEVVLPPQPVAVAQVTQNESKVVPISKPMPPISPVDAEEQYLDDHLSTIRDILVKYRK